MFASQPPSVLEQLESIDMLRWLESGKSVHLCKIDDETHPVDVPSDVSEVERILLMKNAPKR